MSIQLSEKLVSYFQEAFNVSILLRGSLDKSMADNAGKLKRRITRFIDEIKAWGFKD